MPETPMSKRSPHAQAQDAQAYTPAGDRAQVLMDLGRQLVEESRPHAAHAQTLTLDSGFERDLGIDSLARVELLERIERTFGCRNT